jgi:hypothetical protein
MVVAAWRLMSDMNIEFHVSASDFGAIEIAGSESELIERFIAGKCNASERRQVVEFLQSNPHLILQIAQRIRMNRKPSKEVTSSN